MPFRIKVGPGAFEAFRGGALPSTATKWLACLVGIEKVYTSNLSLSTILADDQAPGIRLILTIFFIA